MKNTLASRKMGPARVAGFNVEATLPKTKRTPWGCAPVSRTLSLWSGPITLVFSCNPNPPSASSPANSRPSAPLQNRTYFSSDGKVHFTVKCLSFVKGRLQLSDL